tara:strand:- start:858 stop:1076 length:219 start_codon:yes stop_codon:yes gene_type:complete
LAQEVQEAVFIVMELAKVIACIVQMILIVHFVMEEGKRHVHSVTEQESELAKESDVCLHIGDAEEICPLGER